ncbi:MAG: hypothetical protein R8G66_20190 [Cytophagales bacterium]|nr:hypothetical protein [Cytophagales bacterium]
MFKDWSYKRKNLAFLIGTGLILVLGYFFSISKTLEIRNHNQLLQRSIVNADQLYRKSAVLKRDKKKVDSLLQHLDLQGGEQLLLRQLTRLSKPNLTPLVEYTEVQKRDTKEKFNLFRFSGSYRELLKLLQEVETRRLGGGLVSIRFDTETNRRTRETKLYLALYFPIE